MSEWKPIETAPKDDVPVLLAHFRESQYIWVAMATWGTAMPGYTHCASYQGWFPEMPNLCDPTKGRKRVFSPLILGDVLGDDLPPTHWMPLPEPPSVTLQEPKP